MKKYYLYFIQTLLFSASIFFFIQPANACTGFGAVTESGTIMGKNRDYFYVPQKFGLMRPMQKFTHWYGNPYHHSNKFYAVTSVESISMGVNQNGLTAIEEDALRPQYPHAQDAKEYKIRQQAEGMPDGLVLYGVLQNFNTVDEMIPYLSKIFSTAAPDFYQFADAKKILTIEVGYGKNHSDSKSQFTYQILSKKDDYFAHTNIYLSPEFSALNDLASKQGSFNESIDSAKNRLKRMNYLISHSTEININNASRWFMDTYSNVSSQNDPTECLNTSLFRTDLKGIKSVNKNIPNDKIAGTVASMIVSNQGDFKKSHIYVMMINSVTVQKDGKQLIKYNELHTTLAKLFGQSKPEFVEREFERNPPVKGVCN